MARQYDRAIDRFILSEVFLAQLKLARGDVDGAAASLAQVEQIARQKNFTLRLPDVAAAQVLVLLKQGNAPAAAQLARQYDLPLGQARALLAQGDPTATLAVLEPYRQQVEAKAWQDERLKTLVLQAVALRLSGDKEPALATLAEALALAEPGGFIRLFVDEAENMRLLIADFRASIGKSPHNLLAYAEKLLAAFESQSPNHPITQSPNLLTSRELEILRLIADGLTNEQIANRLYLSLYTVKAHVRNIFAKLKVATRTQAVARARELGLMQ
jgi:LuxR family maltose regulon positive regulatory protein